MVIRMWQTEISVSICRKENDREISEWYNEEKQVRKLPVYFKSRS